MTIAQKTEAPATTEAPQTDSISYPNTSSSKDGNQVFGNVVLGEIYTDGSGTTGSGTTSGAGGWGVAVLFDNEWTELSGSEPEATSQTAELLAAIKGLEWWQANHPDDPVKLLTDSRYTINSVQWAKGWERNGWQTKEGKPVKNRELIEHLVALDRLVKPVWQHVKGHSGIEGNERADRLAGQARKRQISLLSENSPNSPTPNQQRATALVDLHYQEIVQGSGVSETIARLNFKTIEDSREVDKALNRNTNKRWKHSDNLVPGWLVTGVDPKTGERTYQGCQYKPNTPQPKLDSNGEPLPGKVNKYLSASDSPIEPLFLDPGIEGYWQQVLADNQRPIVITEGTKKAGAAQSQGIAAISIPGVWCGQKLGRLKASLKQFCDVGRTVYLAFDSDSIQNPKVRAALDDLGKRIAASGAVVCLLTWEPSEGKGLDDYLVGGGNLQDLIDSALTIEEWRSQCKASKSGQDDKPEKRATADQLIDLARASNVTLWHTPDGEAFADILEDGIRQTLPIRRKPFRQWVSRRFYQQEKRSPSTEAVQQAINTLEALAVYDGEEHQAYLRVAEHEGRIYIDLGTPDWKAVEVSPDGWRLVSDAPVRFQRRETMLPLPLPEIGGSLEALKKCLNLEGDNWVMVITWLLNCFKPAPTYPVLIFHGEAGSGKSTLSSAAKRLVDPGKAPMMPAIGDLRNLSIAANNRHLLLYDNLSGVSSEQSDAICRIATGGGFTHRTLHSDLDETVLEFVRPQILNGIDSLATRGDLLDRSILVKLSPPTERRDAQQFWAEFDQLQPQLFGAMLDILSKALAALPTVQVANLPRMADFARFGVALEQALGLEPGQFLKTYQGVRDECHETAIEASPVAQAIINLMSDRTVWQGAASELLAELNSRVEEPIRKSKLWVSDATRLSKQLTRLAPDLRGIGIDFDSFKSNGKRTLVLEQVAKTASLASLDSTKSTPNPYGEKDIDRDADRDASEKNRDARDASGFETNPSVPASNTDPERNRDARDARDAEKPVYLGDVNQDNLQRW